jgi:hypothetical protein
LRESATPPPTAATGDGGLDSLWSQLIEAVGRASPFTKSYLVEAFPVSATDKLLTIGFDPEFADHVGLVDNAKNHTLIATKLAELGRPGMRVKFVIQDAPAGEAGHEDTAPAPIPAPEGGPSATPSPPIKARTATVKAFDPKDFKNDPLIQDALRIFQAQIVGVRS